MTISSNGSDERARTHAIRGGTSDSAPQTDAARRLTVSGLDSDVATLAHPRGHSLPELRPPLVPGDLGACGGYRVLRLLGRGGMGAVYEAVDTALNRRVALKLMLPGLAASEEGRERFLREARAAAAVLHENVVRVYAVGEDTGAPFLTMELLRGDHLGHLIESGVPPTDVIRIGREVALGLSAAHALGVIHRDIKPANIWIEEPSGRVRLLDFGLARISDDVSALGRGGKECSPDLTQHGAMIGTPMYMAPEQVTGEPTDARADLFSLGAVLYQMVTGRGPFVGPTLLDLAAAVRNGDFIPVPELVPDVEPALARLIHTLLAVDPAARPPSATAVAAELLTIGTGLLLSAGSVVAIPVPVAPTPPSPAFDFDDAPPPAPRRLESPALLLLGTTVALLVVLLFAGTFHRLTKPPVVPPSPAEVAKPPAAPKPVPAAAPFVPLFNGRDLSGWHTPPEGKKDSWEVRDGVIVATPKPGGDQVLLSDAEYTNFECKFEYRWPQSGGHTVVLFRAPNAQKAADTGLALNIGDDEGFPAVHKRGIGELYRTGLFQGATFHPTATNRPIGQWNEVSVLAKRQVIEVKVNRVAMPTADLSVKVPNGRPDAVRPSGSVGLVCHWGPIEFRNITIRPITE